MLSSQFLPKKAPHVQRKFFTQKLALMLIFYQKRPPIYALSFYLKRPPCYALNFYSKKPPM